jgi:hypothetical protein
MWSSAKAPSTASWAARWRLTRPNRLHTGPAYPPASSLLHPLCTLHAATPRHRTAPPSAPTGASLRCAIHSIPTQHPLLDPSSTPSSTPPRQVGAVGTLIATFVKRDQVKDRLKCPYCEGTGIIQCASPPLPLA